MQALEEGWHRLGLARLGGEELVQRLGRDLAEARIVEGPSARCR